VLPTQVQFLDGKGRKVHLKAPPWQRSKRRSSHYYFEGRNINDLNVFSTVGLEVLASPSCAFLLATILRELLIMQSQKLPSNSRELLPRLSVRRMFFNYPLYCGFLLSISSSSLHPLSFQLRQIFIQFHFLPHQNQQLSHSGIFENQNQ
jgi:hypothetical protein